MAQRRNVGLHKPAMSRCWFFEVVSQRGGIAWCRAGGEVVDLPPGQINDSTIESSGRVSGEIKWDPDAAFSRQSDPAQFSSQCEDCRGSLLHAERLDRPRWRHQLRISAIADQQSGKHMAFASSTHAASAFELFFHNTYTAYIEPVHFKIGTVSPVPTTVIWHFGLI